MNDSIQPFRIEIPQSELDFLRERLTATRWPGELPGVDSRRGMPLEEVRKLAEYWRDEYDWRAQERRLNEFPQFITEIDGQRIHFLHLRSHHANAKPLLITHGYPSSFAEFVKLIDDLVDPAEGQAFHVVAPSLPGYGFSTPLSGPGWAMARAARAWVELMRRLGYERYGVHGGDIGAGVSGMVASIDAEHVIGVHVATDPVTAASTATFMPGMADRLNPDDPVDRLILERMASFTQDGSGYLAIQNSRPQTIGYGLHDSPVFQLVWIAEKLEEWTDLPIDRDQLLTIVSLYWFSGSGNWAAHSLYEQSHSSDWGGPVTVPQGFAVFGADATVRRLVPAPEDAHWTEYEQAQHFPALEAPALLADDLRTFFAKVS